MRLPVQVGSAANNFLCLKPDALNDKWNPEPEVIVFITKNLIYFYFTRYVPGKASRPCCKITRNDLNT